MSIQEREIREMSAKFTAWYDGLTKDGKIEPGHKLGRKGKTLEARNVITDGPFPESKEAIGGYWFIVAETLEEAADWPTAIHALNTAQPSKYVPSSPIPPKLGSHRPDPGKVFREGPPYTDIRISGGATDVYFAIRIRIARPRISARHVAIVDPKLTSDPSRLNWPEDLPPADSGRSDSDE